MTINQINTLTFQLLEIIEVGLEGQEYVSLLSWMIQTYPGQDLMKSTSLGIPPEKIKPLLDQKVIDDLQVKYLKVCTYSEDSNTKHVWILDGLELFGW